MLRLVHPAAAPPALIGQLARRALALESRFDVLYVITDCGAGPAANVAAALEIKYVLNAEQPIPAWPEVTHTFPHLLPLCQASTSE